MRLFFTICGLALAFHSFGQTPQNAAIPITITTSINPPAALLTWPADAPADLLLRRRLKGAPGTTWEELLNQPASFLNGYYDINLSNNQIYEYELTRIANSVAAYGYAYAQFLPEPPDNRGKLLVFIDSTSADVLGADLVDYKNDLRAEGWYIVPFKTGPFTTQQWIKNQIVAAYNADPGGVKAVLLMGANPVPYCGGVAWDAAPDHIGAWPCDAWYGDIDGVWTDQTVNLPNTTRAANRNVPGDGKWDQSVLPSAVELPVGRLDFTGLSAQFGSSPIELLRQYLFKGRQWRNGLYETPNSVLVEDQAGWAGGEAWAADGWRNGFAISGANNTHSGDFDQLKTDRHLMAFGMTSAGNYGAATGIVSSADAAGPDSLHAVFAGIYGPYCGDWDFEVNPLLPALLASKGGILASFWAGKPQWRLQGLAVNENIGHCLLETQNAQFNNAYGNSAGESGAHIALMGDPTLRAFYVKPPTQLTVTSNCDKVNLHWKASADPEISGYHIYRAFGQDGPYTRMTTGLVFDTAWADLSPIADTLFYVVRAVKLQSTPGGGAFYNMSAGPIKWTIFTPGTPPVALGQGGTINCIHPSFTLGAHVEPSFAPFTWFKPDGSPLGGYVATEGGVYRVVVTAPNGCTAEAFASVTVDTLLPDPVFPASVTLNCVQPEFQYEVPFGGAGIQFSYDNQSVYSGQNITLIPNAPFVVSSTVNGCSHTYSAQISQDFSPPGASISTDYPALGCNVPVVQLTASSDQPDAVFQWAGNNIIVVGAQATVNQPGLYCVTTTGLNGCTSSACIDIESSGGALNTQIVSNAPTCNDGLPIFLQCQVTGGGNQYAYLWSDGSTTSDIILPAGFGGTIGVTVNDNGGCLGASAWEINPPMTLQIEADPTLCAPIGPIALTTQTNGGDGNYTWLWSNGLSAPNNQLPEGFSGSVWVSVTDQSGCTAIAQTTISGPINVLAITDVPSDAQAADGRIELIVYGGAQPYSFMWSNGATDQNISGLSSGTYTVTVTGSNGCTTEITIPLSVVGAEIASALQSVAIYPNPVSSGKITIKLNHMEAFNNLKCQLFHSTGALVGTIELFSEETQLDVGDLPEGAYYLRLAGVEKAFVIVR